jgi:hypothetical protein
MYLSPTVHTGDPLADFLFNYFKKARNYANFLCPTFGFRQLSGSLGRIGGIASETLQTICPDRRSIGRSAEASSKGSPCLTLNIAK